MTSVKVKGEWYPLGLTVDDTTGLVLTVEGLSGEDAATLEEWMAPIAEAVGAEVLVTDDADAFKTVADDLGRDHQVCKSHVKRNTELSWPKRPSVPESATMGVACPGFCTVQKRRKGGLGRFPR